MKSKNAVLLKISIFLAGIGSLIWFLIRVIPKPSRASYPCMRVAAPMASTFVLWLLGFGSSFMLIKKAKEHFKREHYVTAITCLILAGIFGGVFISMSDSKAFADPRIPNQPIGEAKGAIPGRVVWVHDSSVSNWDGLGDGHWWEDGKTNQDIVDEMFSRLIKDLGNENSDTASWDTIFKYYKTKKGLSNGYIKGEKFAIKVNFTFCNHYPEYCCVDSNTYSLKNKLDYMNTSPQVIVSLLKQLVYVVGVNQSDISIGDPVAYFPNEYYDYIHEKFPDVKYIDYTGKFGRVKAEYSEIPFNWSCRPNALKGDFIPKHYAEATYVISLANMKSHMGAGITLCAKNHYGSLIRLPLAEEYYNLHESLPYKISNKGNYRTLVDIMGYEHLGGKTIISIIDGLYAGNHNQDTVPQKWNIDPFNGRWTSSLFASQDPVALESVLFDLLQLDEDKYQYAKIAGADDYLVEAAMADNPPSGTFYDPNHETPTERLKSLGVYEHWNNSNDRQYSRNLGAEKGIELVFINGATSTPINNNKLNRISKNEYQMKVLNNGTLLEYSIPDDQFVKLKVFDTKGRILKVISEGFASKGIHRVDLFSKLERRQKLSAGKYIIALYANVDGVDKKVCFTSINLLR